MIGSGATLAEVPIWIAYNDRTGPVQPSRTSREDGSMRIEPVGPPIEALNPWHQPIGAGKHVMLMRAKFRVDGRRKRRTVYAIVWAEL